MHIYTHIGLTHTGTHTYILLPCIIYSLEYNFHSVRFYLTCYIAFCPIAAKTLALFVNFEIVKGLEVAVYPAHIDSETVQESLVNDVSI